MRSISSSRCAAPRAGFLLGLAAISFLISYATADNLKVGVTLTFIYDYNFIITVIMAHLDLMKHFNSTIRERFGEPILPIDNPHQNLSTVEVLTRECAANAVTAMKGSQELIVDHKVNVVTGDFYFGSCESTGGLAAANQVPHIALCVSETLGDRTRYPYTFRNSVPMAIGFNFMWQYMNHFKFRSAILLYTNDGFGTSVNDIKDNAIQEGRGSAILSLALIGSPPYDEQMLAMVASQMLASPTRLIVLGVRSDACDAVHTFMINYNLTRPRYQILTSSSSRNSAIFSTKFIGWHSVAAHVSDEDGSVSKWYEMRAKMTQDDINDALDKYGISDWSPVPYFAAKLPSNKDFVDSELTEFISSFSFFTFNAINTAFAAMNELLNEGYDNDEIRGSLLRSKINSLEIRGIGKNTSFDSNQDADALGVVSQWTNVTWQYDRSTTRWALLPETDLMIISDDHGNFPNTTIPIMWPDGTYGTYPPKEYNQCFPGMYIDSDGSCAECPDGSVSSEFDTAECTKCQLGSYSNEGKTMCMNCTAGKIAAERGMSICVACPAGQYMPHDGGSSCSLCPTGSYVSTSGATACTECTAPLSTAQVGSISSKSCICPAGTYSDADGVCQTCPKGIDCVAGAALDNLPSSAAQAATIDTETNPYPSVAIGYYTTYSEPLSVYLCKEGDWCPGGPPESCATNADGIGCGNCIEGYFRDVEGSCAECSSVMRTRGLLILLPTLAIPVIFKMAQDTSDVTTWYRAKNVRGPLAYIGLFFIQSLALYSTFSVALPNGTTSLTNSFSITLDFRSIIRPECAEFYEYSANFFAGLATPIYFAFIVVLTWAISVVIGRWWHEIRIRWCVALSFFGACYSTFFVSIANLTLNLFSCYPHPNGKSSLRTSPHVLCYEDDWSALVGFGSVGIFVYCVGAMALMIVAIWQAPRYYYYATYRLATKFLFVRFRTGYAYWSVILLLKGLAVSITSVMFSDGVSQFLWINFVLTAYVPFTAALMPWRSLPVSLVDILTHMALSYSFGLGGFFAAASDSEQSSVSKWLVVCVVVVAIGITVVGVHSLYLKYMQDHKEPALVAKREQMAHDLATEMKRMVESPALLSYLFKVLPDWEIRNFKIMQKIIWREANFTTSVSVSIGEDPALLRTLTGKTIHEDKEQEELQAAEQQQQQQQQQQKQQQQQQHEEQQPLDLDASAAELMAAVAQGGRDDNLNAASQATRYDTKCVFI